MFVLDTDHFSLMERKAGAARENLLRRLRTIPPREVFTTILTYEGQTRGWMAYAARARTTAQQIEAYGRLERHVELYRPVQVLGFDGRAGTEFERLRASRIRIGAMDLRIAAITLIHNATVLTRNIKELHSRA